MGRRRLPPEITARTVPQILEAAVTAAPNRDALIAHSLIEGAEVHLTYADLADRVCRFAAVLGDRGVTAGHRVAIMIGNDGSVEAHIAYHAIHYLGAICVPINTLYVDRELAFAFSVIEPRAVIFSPEFTALMETVRDVVPRDCVLLEVSAVPTLGESVHDLIETASTNADRVEVTEDDDADWIFTSGTTGNPKAVAHTHESSAACGHAARCLWELQSDSIYQCSSPFFTSTGCHTNQLACLAAQCTEVVDPAPDIADMLDRARRVGTTSIFLITPIVAMLLNRLDQGRLDRLDTGQIAHMSYGGQAMPKKFFERVEKEFAEDRGIALGTVYGLTEAGTNGLFFGPEDHAEAVRRCGAYGLSIGRKAWTEWTEWAIVTEEEEAASPGEVGEIRLRSPGTMSRYVGNPDATAEAIKDGWLHTGDIATIDDGGFVYFVDRSKNLIRRGAMNISSAEVEAVLSSHDAVREVAVIPESNPVLGEDVHAVVVLEAGADATAEDLIAFCTGKLAEYKRPRKVSFLDDLPRNGMGKVVKGDLARTLEASSG